MTIAPEMDISQDVSARIRGEVGTEVTLVVKRGETTLTFVIIRQEIDIPSVNWRLLDPPSQTGGNAADAASLVYVQITSFSDRTADELKEGLDILLTRGARGLILDLRGNGGGWVTSAQEMIGRFVPDNAGPALYRDLDLEENGDLASEPIIAGGETAFEIPLAVLIDGGTASAAEIVAGAIRDYERGVLVGTNTFGKGLVQQICLTNTLQGKYPTKHSNVKPDSRMDTTCTQRKNSYTTAISNPTSATAFQFERWDEPNTFDKAHPVLGSLNLFTPGKVCAANHTLTSLETKRPSLSS